MYPIAHFRECDGDPLSAGINEKPAFAEAWLRMAASSEAFAFLARTAEDIYTIEDGKPLSDTR